MKNKEKGFINFYTIKLKNQIINFFKDWFAFILS